MMRPALGDRGPDPVEHVVVEPAPSSYDRKPSLRSLLAKPSYCCQQHRNVLARLERPYPQYERLTQGVASQQLVLLLGRARVELAVAAVVDHADAFRIGAEHLAKVVAGGCGDRDDP